MPTAFILLNIEINSEDQVKEKLKEILQSAEFTSEIKEVYGVYDMIIKIVAKNMDIIKNTIAKIRRIDKIYSTVTMLVTEEQHLS